MNSTCENQDYQTDENTKAETRKLIRKMLFIYKALQSGFEIKMTKNNEFQFKKVTISE